MFCTNFAGHKACCELLNEHINIHISRVIYTGNEFIIATLEMRVLLSQQLQSIIHIHSYMAIASW